MASKPHLYFRGERVHRGGFRYKSRYRGADDGIRQDRDYRPMQDVFLQSLNNFNRKRDLRRERRNPDIQVSHMDYIRLDFFDVYDLSSFEATYRDSFGLSPVFFNDFNRSGLFAIESRHRFENFIRDVQTFIDADDPLNSGENYSPAIRFIKSFDGFSTDEMLRIQQPHPNVVIDLFKTPRLFNQFILPVRERLIAYLEQRNIPFALNDQAETVELGETEWDFLVEIADNFDIIQSISSHTSGVIRPSRFGTPIREFGFSVTEEGLDNLPIIGILDSGVSDQTPINPLLVHSDTPFDLTNTDPFDDHIDHGTGVATLAALGSRPYPDFRGNFEADARILSIKIIHENHSPISQKGVIEAIRRANRQFGVKLFVLTILWDDHKTTHENPSEYTFALDRLANELDILIFICTGNRNTILQPNGVPLDYPDHFLEDDSNLKTPADSMNNISIGAIADDLSGRSFRGLSMDNGYPAIYTRKFHYDWTDRDLKKSIVNLKLHKPDILMPGGDFDQDGYDDVYGIQVLSSEPGIFYKKFPGTSYAAPLAANLAARLLRLYPDISSMQSLKALLINSSRDVHLGREFDELPDRLTKAVCGHGVPIETLLLYSEDHRATFIIEGAVNPEQLEVVELKLPEYLQQSSKSKALLKVYATLCFKFDPVPDNQLAYCPVHFAFGFFKNVPPEQITSEKLEDVKLKKGWSEDHYFKDSILSNTQKVDFSISKPDLVREDNTVLIGVHSRLHRHLDAGRIALHNKAHEYSLVVSIEETTKEKERSNSLYDELVAINQLEVITEIEIDLEV